MDAPPDPRRRIAWRWMAAGVTVLAAVAVLGFFRPWGEPARPEVDAAARVADALRTGVVSPGTFDDPDAGTQLTAIRKGMVPLTPEVRVTNVVADADAGTGSAVLEQRWVIHSGKQPWSYTTTVALRRTPDGWRGTWAPSVVCNDLGTGDSLKAVRLPAQRGEVIGADGVRLVFQQTVMRVGLDLTLTDRTTALASADQLASIMGMDADAYVARVRAAGDRAFVEAGTLRTYDPAQNATLARAGQLAGVKTVLSTRMLGRTPSFARPFLGTVGDATAEVIAASNGDVRDGDQVGLSGLQAAQDRTLRGVTGFAVQRVSVAGASTDVFKLLPVAGTSVSVALDVARQDRADTAVAQAAKAGRRAALVVLRPSDGHVLAVASAGGDGTSAATGARIALGATPAGLADAVAPLRWGTSGQLGVPVFLGESSAQSFASPLGLAEASASARRGEAVIPVLVTDGEPARPALSAEQSAALRSLVASAEASPTWAVKESDDLVVVAWDEGGAADALLRAGG